MLVHSVFEAAPPASVRREAEASEREHGEQRSTNGQTSPSASENDTASSGTATPKATQRRAPRKAAVPDSPLAKLYGQGGGSASRAAHHRRVEPRQKDIESGGRSASGKQAVSGSQESETGEVDVLKKELQEVRESQLRMEKLLNKLLAGAADK